MPTASYQQLANTKYKDFIQKNGQRGRVVLLYDQQPNWHAELDRSLRQLDRNDISADFREVQIDPSEMYNKAERFEELQ
jgi:hypothetical protein